MAKSKRNRRAKNKIAASVEGALIKAEPSPFSEPAATVQRTHSVRVARPTLFSAEFEQVIELIARERVYRAMLAGMGVGRRLLMAPTNSGDDLVA